MADNLDTPYSRREIFYKGILDQDPDSLPDPETREERYLKAIAEAYPTPVEATVTQDEGSSTTSVMSQKAVTDALDGLRDSKLDKTGTAPLADNLTPYSADSGATQSVPFINQGTGCGNGESIVDTGSYAQIKKKLGNTASVNQLVDSDTTEVTIPSGRKYWARINGTDVGGTSDGTAVAVTGGTDKFCDLSLWFGSTDRIPSHLLSHPEDFGRYYSGSLAYNPGQLVNADGSYLKSISRNCNSGDGDVLAIPNQAYYCKGTATITYKDRDGNTISTESVTNTSFTTPADCFSFAVSGTVTISLYYSGESGYDSDYPYSVLAQIDTGSEVLRGVEGSRDEKLPNGTITRNRAVIDLGSLDYYYVAASKVFYAILPTAAKFPVNDGTAGSAISGGYVCYPYNTLAGNLTIDKGMSLRKADSTFRIRNLAYTNVATFKAAVSGIMLEYPLATPTTEQGTPFSGASADNFTIDDFGSMMWTQTNGVPQGVEIFYPYDYKAAVDTLLNMVDGDVEELVTETELGAVADRIPEAPAEDGTYTLKATVASGVKTYVWVADE